MLRNSKINKLKNFFIACSAYSSILCNQVDAATFHSRFLSIDGLDRTAEPWANIVGGTVNGFGEYVRPATLFPNPDTFLSYVSYSNDDNANARFSDYNNIRFFVPRAVKTGYKKEEEIDDDSKDIRIGTIDVNNVDLQNNILTIEQNAVIASITNLHRNAKPDRLLSVSVEPGVSFTLQPREEDIIKPRKELQEGSFEIPERKTDVKAFNSLGKIYLQNPSIPFEERIETGSLLLTGIVNSEYPLKLPKTSVHGINPSSRLTMSTNIVVNHPSFAEFPKMSLGSTIYYHDEEAFKPLYFHINLSKRKNNIKDDRLDVTAQDINIPKNVRYTIAHDDSKIIYEFDTQNYSPIFNLHENLYNLKAHDAPKRYDLNLDFIVNNTPNGDGSVNTNHLEFRSTDDSNQGARFSLGTEKNKIANLNFRGNNAGVVFEKEIYVNVQNLNLNSSDMVMAFNGSKNNIENINFFGDAFLDFRAIKTEDQAMNNNIGNVNFLTDKGMLILGEGTNINGNVSNAPDPKLKDSESDNFIRADMQLRPQNSQFIDKLGNRFRAVNSNATVLQAADSRVPTESDVVPPLYDTVSMILSTSVVNTPRAATPKVGNNFLLSPRTPATPYSRKGTERSVMLFSPTGRVELPELGFSNSLGNMVSLWNRESNKEPEQNNRLDIPVYSPIRMPRILSAAEEVYDNDHDMIFIRNSGYDDESSVPPSMFNSPTLSRVPSEHKITELDQVDEDSEELITTNLGSQVEIKLTPIRNPSSMRPNITSFASEQEDHFDFDEDFVGGTLILTGNNIVRGTVGMDIPLNQIIAKKYTKLSDEDNFDIEGRKEVSFLGPVNTLFLVASDNRSIIFSDDVQVSRVDILDSESDISISNNKQLTFFSYPYNQINLSNNMENIKFLGNNAGISFSNTPDMEKQIFSVTLESSILPRQNGANHINFNNGPDGLIIIDGGAFGQFDEEKQLKFNQINIRGNGQTIINSNIAANAINIGSKDEKSSLSLFTSKQTIARYITINDESNLTILADNNDDFYLNKDREIILRGSDAYLNLDVSQNENGGDVRFLITKELKGNKRNYGNLVFNNNYKGEDFPSTRLVLDADLNNRATKVSIGSRSNKFSKIRAKGNVDALITKDIDISNVNWLSVEDNATLHVQTATISEIPNIIIGSPNSKGEASLIINPIGEDRYLLINNSREILFNNLYSSLVLTNSDDNIEVTNFIIESPIQPGRNIENIPEDLKGNLLVSAANNKEIIVSGANPELFSNFESIGISYDDYNIRLGGVELSGQGDVTINVPIYAKVLEISNSGVASLMNVDTTSDNDTDSLIVFDYENEDSIGTIASFNGDIKTNRIDVNNSYRQIEIVGKVNIDTPFIDNGLNSEIILTGDSSLTFSDYVDLDIRINPQMINSNNNSIFFPKGGTIRQAIGSANNLINNIDFGTAESVENNYLELHSNIYSNQNNFYNTNIDIQDNVTIAGNNNMHNVNINLNDHDIYLQFGHTEFFGQSKVITNANQEKISNIIVSKNASISVNEGSHLDIIVNHQGIIPNNQMITLIKREDDGEILLDLSNISVIEKTSEEQHRTFSSWEVEINDYGMVLINRSILAEESERIALENGNENIINEEVRGVLANFESGTEAEEVVEQWANMAEEKNVNDSQVKFFTAKHPVKEATDRNLRIIQDVNEVVEGHILEVTTIDPATINDISSSIALNNDDNGLFAITDDGYISGVSAGDDSKKFGVWASSFFEKNKQQQYKYSAGYNSCSYGLTIGADTKTSERNVVGLAISAAGSDIKHSNFKKGDHTDVKALLLSLYTNYQINSNSFIQGVLSVGSSETKNHSLRRISDTQIGVANSKSSSISSSVEALIGYNYLAGNRLVVTPIFGLDYTRIEGSKYKEYGTATSQLLEINKKYSQKLDLITGLRFTSMPIQKGPLVFIPEIHGLINHDLIDKGVVIETKLPGFPTIPGVRDPLQRTFYNLGFGFDIGYRMMDYTFSFDSIWASKYQSLRGSIKVRVNF